MAGGWGLVTLDGFRMGTGHQKDQGMFRGLEISDSVTPTLIQSLPHTLGRGWRLTSVTNSIDLIHHAYITNLHKTLSSRVQDASGLVNTSRWGGSCAHGSSAHPRHRIPFPAPLPFGWS